MPLESVTVMTSTKVQSVERQRSPASPPSSPGGGELDRLVSSPRGNLWKHDTYHNGFLLDDQFSDNDLDLDTRDYFITPPPHVSAPEPAITSTDDVTAVAATPYVAQTTDVAISPPFPIVGSVSGFATVAIAATHSAVIPAYMAPSPHAVETVYVSALFPEVATTVNPLELLQTPVGASKKSVQLNSFSQQLEVVRGSVVDLKLPLVGAVLQVDLQMRHADAEFSELPIVNCGDPAHANKKETNLVFDVVTEDRSTSVTTYVDSAKFENATVCGNVDKIRIRFNCLGSCKQNLGNTEHARKWHLRCQWRDESDLPHLKDIPLQVLTKLKAPDRLKKTLGVGKKLALKRSANGAAAAAIPVVELEGGDTASADALDAWKQQVDTHFALVKSQFWTYPRDVQTYIMNKERAAFLMDMKRETN